MRRAGSRVLNMVRLDRIERSTYRLEVCCSIRLSYRRIQTKREIHRKDPPRNLQKLFKNAANRISGTSQN